MSVLRLLPAALIPLAACAPPADEASQPTGNVSIQVRPADTNPAGSDRAVRSPPPMLPEATRAPSPPANVAQATIGGDGSDIVLAPLGKGDADTLQGELACSFAADAQAAPLLIARADVGKGARGTAAIRNGEVLETLVSTTPGGFGAVENGTTFGGKGITARLTRQARLQTGNESSAYRATLRIQRADGAERSYAGLWTCGP